MILFVCEFRIYCKESFCFHRPMEEQMTGYTLSVTLWNFGFQNNSASDAFISATFSSSFRMHIFKFRYSFLFQNKQMKKQPVPGREKYVLSPSFFEKEKCSSATSMFMFLHFQKFQNDILIERASSQQLFSCNLSCEILK